MTLEAGALINQNVRLKRLLGQGGMGTVWLAEHITLRTQVAVKFILAEYISDTDALDRFTREATSSAKIKSPNVVQVFDRGLFDGHPYIVMEFLEGEDLEARMARAPLALGEIGPILQQIGKALTQAHALGIVHRDIKPANIFLTTAGDDLLVKLLDFGVAKTTRGFDDTNFKKTQTGLLIGTPCFMSPEQIFSRGVIDHGADLWALGVLVYEALTGALPFEGTTVGDVYIAINSGKFLAPSRVDRAFPLELDAWFTRVFARDIAARFGSARALCDTFLAIAARAPLARHSLVAARVVASRPSPHRHLTLGATASSRRLKKAAWVKLVLSVGTLSVVVCACAAAIALLGHPPSTIADGSASFAGRVSGATSAIVEPRGPTTASAAEPEIVVLASAAAIPASAAPLGAGPAPHPMKIATSARPTTPPAGSSKRRDHGF